MRRAARTTAWTLGSVLALLALLAIAVLVVGNTTFGRTLIERGVASVSGGRVRLQGLTGTFPQALELGQLQLSDANGTWLTAQQLSLRWSPLALLRWHVQLDALRIASLDIERRPVSQPTKSTGSSRPPHADLRQLSIDRLELGPQLAGARVLLSVSGALHFRSLTEATVQVRARRSDGQGEYRLSARLAAQRMDANLSLQEPASGPLENLLGYPGLGPLSVEATVGGPRNAERLELNARAGGLVATASGTLDFDRESAALDYRVQAPAMTPRPGLSWQRISLAGRWDGQVRSAHATARLELSALEIPGGAGAGQVEATMTASDGMLSLKGQAAGLTLPGRASQLLAKSPVQFEGAMQLQSAQRPLQLEARHPLFTLQAHAVTAGAPQLTFALRLPDLTPLAALGGEKIAGRAEATGTVRQEATATHLQLQVDGALARAPTAVAALIGGVSRIQLAAELTPRSLVLERLRLSTSNLSVTASGTADRGSTPDAPLIRSMHARYAGSIADVSALSASVTGSVSAQGSVDGPPTALGATARLTSSLSVRGARRESLKASITARGLPALASAELEADGRFDGAPLQLAATLERVAGDAFHVTVQRAAWKSARLDGDLITGASPVPGRGMLRLRIGRLADLESLTGTSLGGSLEADLELQGRRGRTYARARLQAQDLLVAAVPASVLLTAEGPTEALALHLSARSGDVRGKPASLESALHLDLDHRTVALEQAQLHYQGQTLRLLDPARVSYADGLSVSKLQLRMHNAILTLEGRFSPALDLRASLHHVDAGLVNAFLPDTLAEGTLDAEAHLQGQPSAPSGTVSANAAGVRFANAGARDLHGLDVHASGRLAAGSVRLDAQLTAGASSRLVLAGSAPLGAGGAAMDLKLTGALDAALANPLLEASGRRAGGTFAVNIDVKGSASSPDVSGTVDLRHGELRDYVQGVHLSEISAHLVGEHGALRIASCTARAAPGELTVTGTLGVMQPKVPLDLEVVAKNAQPITSNLLTARLDADLKLTGTLSERVQVAGSLDLHRAVIGIPNSLPPDVAVLDVRRPGQAPPAPAEHKLVIALDLRMHAPREVLVQGRGLNAELGGDLHLTGTTEQPRVSGGFEMVRGTFALASSTLTFTRGEVTFNGAGLKGRIDPTLDFTAQSTVADATATLHITGLADAPQFELSSSPPLPQDEILARLLFGESAAQLTALQLAEIGAALASLGGVGGGGTNPLVKVQKALGLDRLSVGSASGSNGSAQNSGTSVEAGRYVSSRVFVGAKQSTTGFSQVEVDVDLSKHLKLQTRLGNGSATTQGTTPENDPGSSVGLTYQFEY